jgi:hypothetical protein
MLKVLKHRENFLISKCLLVLAACEQPLIQYSLSVFSAISKKNERYMSFLFVVIKSLKYI